MKNKRIGVGHLSPKTVTNLEATFDEQWLAQVAQLKAD